MSPQPGTRPDEEKRLNKKYQDAKDAGDEARMTAIADAIEKLTGHKPASKEATRG